MNVPKLLRRLRRSLLAPCLMAYTAAQLRQLMDSWDLDTPKEKE